MQRARPNDVLRGTVRGPIRVFGIIVVLWLLLAGSQSAPAADENGRRAEIERILAKAPKLESGLAKRMKVVLLADTKDHGPAGNGLHDYPLWQERWSLLLGGPYSPSNRLGCVKSMLPKRLCNEIELNVDPSAR